MVHFAPNASRTRAWKSGDSAAVSLSNTNSTGVYHSFLQKVHAGEVVLKHVPEAQNPADCLTKWVGAEKFNLSIDYLTGAAAGKARAARRSCT